MDGSLVTVDDRPALRFERHLDHPVERVWQAITDPEELRRWYPGVPKWDLKQGAPFTNEDGQGSGQITEVDPPSVLAYTWGAERFRFEVRPVGDGCRLVFTHVFDDRALGAQHAAGWEVYLTRLDSHLAGQYLSEEAAHDAVPEMHERYAERFELDSQVGRRMIATTRRD